VLDRILAAAKHADHTLSDEELHAVVAGGPPDTL
jgi:hypothetical protein